MPPTETDQIILRVLSGDIDAYAEIVRGYQHEVWKVVAALLLDTQRTEDLVQQSFIQAYQHLHRFQPGRDFAPWIKAIARNVVREQMRAQSREGRRLELYYNHWLQFYNAPASTERDELLREALENCAGKLPPAASEMIQLRYHRALSFSEIAATLGRTVEATRQALSRIRLALRDCIEKEIARP
jgi:RNA polymerase sigma-70 factor (ECF subfamily)